MKQDHPPVCPEPWCGRIVVDESKNSTCFISGLSLYVVKGKLLFARNKYTIAAHQVCAWAALFWKMSKENRNIIKKSKIKYRKLTAMEQAKRNCFAWHLWAEAQWIKSIPKAKRRRYNRHGRGDVGGSTAGSRQGTGV